MQNELCQSDRAKVLKELKTFQDEMTNTTVVTDDMLFLLYPELKPGSVANVMIQANVTNQEAVKALFNSKGSTFRAITNLKMIQGLNEATLREKFNLDPSDIKLVMEQADVSKMDAMKALMFHQGDIVTAIDSFQ